MGVGVVGAVAVAVGVGALLGGADGVGGADGAVEALNTALREGSCEAEPLLVAAGGRVGREKGVPVPAGECVPACSDAVCAGLLEPRGDAVRVPAAAEAVAIAPLIVESSDGVAAAVRDIGAEMDAAALGVPAPTTLPEGAAELPPDNEGAVVPNPLQVGVEVGCALLLPTALCLALSEGRGLPLELKDAAGVEESRKVTVPPPPPLGEAVLLRRGVAVSLALPLALPDTVALSAGSAEGPGERVEEGVDESRVETAGDPEASWGEIEGAAEKGAEGLDVPLSPPVDMLGTPEGALSLLALLVWDAPASLVAAPLALAVAAPLRVGRAVSVDAAEPVVKVLVVAEDEARLLIEAAALPVAGAPLPLAGAVASALRVAALEKIPLPLPTALARPVPLPLGDAAAESAPVAVSEGMLGAGLALPPPPDALARAVVEPRSSALGAALEEAVGAGAEGEPPPVAEKGAEAGGETVAPTEAEPAPPALPEGRPTVADGVPLAGALKEALGEARALRDSEAELEGERAEEGESIEEVDGGGE